MDLLLHRANQTGLLSYQIVSDPRRVRGISQLVQEVVVELLSDYDPVTGRGSDLQRQLSDVVLEDSRSAQSAASSAVTSVLGVILRRQQRNPNLTGQERLADLRLLNIEQTSSSSWAIDLQLMPASGGSSTVRVDQIEV